MKIKTTSDVSYHVMITNNSGLLIDKYYTTLSKATTFYKDVLRSDLASDIQVSLYIRIYYFYVNINNKIDEKCNHILIDNYSSKEQLIK